MHRVRRPREARTLRGLARRRVGVATGPSWNIVHECFLTQFDDAGSVSAIAGGHRARLDALGVVLAS